MFKLRIFINLLVVIIIALLVGCQHDAIITKASEKTEATEATEKTETAKIEETTEKTEEIETTKINGSIDRIDENKSYNQAKDEAETLKAIIQEVNLNNDEFSYLISELPINDINSIKKAVGKYKDLAGENYELNDNRFRVFRVFFYNLIKSENDVIWDNYDKVREYNLDMLKENGIRINSSESGEYLASRPSFLYNEFGNYLSDSLREYEQIKMQELLEIGDEEHSTYLIEDAALFISWDELSDRIIRLENYINKYPDTLEKEEALNSIGYYIWIYTASALDNTPVYQGNKLSESVMDSYKRFINTYEESNYYDVISGYYDILSKNGFYLNDDVIKYLENNDINVDMLKVKV